MNEIIIKVECPQLADAINNLANAIVGTLALPQSVDTADTAAEIQLPAEVENGSKISLPEVEQTVADVPTPNVPTAPPTPTITLDALSRAGAELIDNGKMPQLLELLNGYNVQAITQLKQEQYGGVAEQMKALGARF